MLIVGFAGVHVVDASVGRSAGARALVPVRGGGQVRPGKLAALEAFVPAKSFCGLALQRGATLVRSPSRRALRAEVQFIWRVPGMLVLLAGVLAWGVRFGAGALQGRDGQGGWSAAGR